MPGRAHTEALRGRAWRATLPRSQRQRLLDAITGLAISDGYSDLTVAQVIAAAGVSRTTFYGCFEGREQCFAAALAPVAQQLLGGIREAVASAHPQHALRTATQALLAHARAQPARTRLLIGDTLTGGRELRDVRDRFIDDAARMVEHAHARLPADAAVPGLPAWLVLGAACRMLASRNGGGAQASSELADGLTAWIEAYDQPVVCERWLALARLAPAARSAFLPVALRPPRAPAAGGPSVPERVLAEHNWLRIVFATAEVVRCEGSSSATVAQITSAAGVDARVFYRLFAGKQDALEAAGELLFRHSMAAAAGAFVSGETWPERVWEAARALVQYADENPTLSYVALLESYGAKSGAGQRVQDLAQAFTVFLQGRDPRPSSPDGSSELMLEAISMAALELCYRRVREHGVGSLAPLLGQIVLISLAPFLGARQAAEFVCGCPNGPHERAALASAA